MIAVDNSNPLAGSGGLVLATIAAFLPRLIAAVIILVVGWVIADFIGRLVARLLERVGFERAAAHTGVSGMIARTGSRLTASRAIGLLVTWMIRLVAIEVAASALHLTEVTVLLNRVILFIPNLVVALVVVMIGALVGKLLAGMVRGSAGEVGLGNPDLLGQIVQYAVVAFAVVIAVNQVGIATTIVNTLFGAVLLALALAFGLAFGLGGRDVAAQITQRWYAKSQEVGQRTAQKREAEELAERQRLAAGQLQAASATNGGAGSEYSVPVTRGPQGTL
ncbi:MAG: mechanosensitive ion channel [Candidatus Dormibacteria bacterium]